VVQSQLARVDPSVIVTWGNEAASGGRGANDVTADLSRETSGRSGLTARSSAVRRGLSLRDDSVGEHGRKIREGSAGREEEESPAQA